MPRTAFLSTGFHVPARVVTNDDLAKIMDTSDEWIVQRSGIKTRHWVDTGDTGVGLALVAQQAELHGGTAKLEASPLGGARLVLRLPGPR